MHTGVVDAFETAEADPAIRVILLTGTGDTFTSGNDDIKDFRQRAASSNTAAASPFLSALVALTKPLIAAVNGAAIGVGTTMLPHCDLIVAARSARFVMPCTWLALVPEAGSSLLFPQLPGHQKAAEIHRPPHQQRAATNPALRGPDRSSQPPQTAAEDPRNIKNNTSSRYPRLSSRRRS